MKNKLLTSLLLLASILSYGQQAHDHVTIAKNIFEAFNTHDWEKMVSYYANDAIFEDPAFTKPITDKKIIIAHYKEMQNMFPDIQDEVKEIYDAGQNIIVEFISTSTLNTGEKFIIPICTVLTFKDGKIIRDRTYYDQP